MLEGMRKWSGPAFTQGVAFTLAMSIKDGRCDALQLRAMAVADGLHEAAHNATAAKLSHQWCSPQSERASILAEVTAGSTLVAPARRRVVDCCFQLPPIRALRRSWDRLKSWRVHMHGLLKVLLQSTNADPLWTLCLSLTFLTPTDIYTSYLTHSATNLLAPEQRLTKDVFKYQRET